MIRRLRTFTLWTGTLLSVLIAVEFVVSAWCVIGIQFPTSRGPTLLIGQGAAILGTGRMQSVALQATRYSSFNLSRWNSWDHRRPEYGAHGVPISPVVTYLTFPIYAVFLAVSIPTLLAWRLGRKPVKPGHCRCGYDLTGNTSGVCPECGIEVQA